MPDTKDCPFCGPDALSVNFVMREGAEGTHVSCWQCGLEGKICQSDDEAISAWNDRAESVPEILKAIDKNDVIEHIARLEAENEHLRESLKRHYVEPANIDTSLNDVKFPGGDICEAVGWTLEDKDWEDGNQAA